MNVQNRPSLIRSYVQQIYCRQHMASIHHRKHANKHSHAPTTDHLPQLNIQQPLGTYPSTHPHTPTTETLPQTRFRANIIYNTYDSITRFTQMPTEQQLGKQQQRPTPTAVQTISSGTGQQHLAVNVKGGEK
ncbi:uncharacterized protein LOC118742261 [Rhagoletis pomonella]|uniref:uncharacterized protein LOC118742261 n=1 Tax=Rhagoletis pomonella TaxID=28610 RepID=UPI0017863AD4|nr:uncharacterized protein LOC118742261 [Rhagoletis pomonella]